MIRHGHYGRPVLVFPSQGGRAEDFADHGMVSAVQWLVDDGRVTFFCVDSIDAGSRLERSGSMEERTQRSIEERTQRSIEERAQSSMEERAQSSMEERAQSHAMYQGWLEQAVVPAMFEILGGHEDVITLGASGGAYHAMRFAFQRADLAPLAIGLSGTYDVGTWHARGEREDGAYFTNLSDYVASLDEDHLDWLRQRLSILLVCGQGDRKAHPTGALPSTRRFAELLSGKGIAHQLDLWGNDVTHDWPWWGRQLAHHLPRFC
ncbi:MAG: esterase family protein [Dermatophilaceae bacterium]